MSWFSHSDNFQEQRERMARTQIADRGIRDARVLQAMLKVPRHEFVPEDSRDRAYEDYPLPIGEGQTISQPYIVATMLERLDLNASDRVLEVGTGSGYATALLATLVERVYSIERHAALAESAEKTLQEMGFTNVQIKVGDGSLGWPEVAPFDAILVSAASAGVPPELFAQMHNGGRLIIPVGSVASQELQLIRKISGGAEIQILEGCRFVPLVREEVRE